MPLLLAPPLLAVALTASGHASSPSSFSPECPARVSPIEVRARLASEDLLGARFFLNCYLFVNFQDSDNRRVSSDLAWREGDVALAAAEAELVLSDPAIGTYDEPRFTLTRRFARLRAGLDAIYIQGNTYTGSESNARAGLRVAKSVLTLTARRARRAYAGGASLEDRTFGLTADMPLTTQASLGFEVASGLGRRNAFLPRSDVGLFADVALWPTGAFPVDLFAGVRRRTYALSSVPSGFVGVVFPSGTPLRLTVRGDVAVLGNGTGVFNGTGAADYDPTSWLGVRIGVTGGRAVEDASKDDGFTEAFGAVRVSPHARVALGLEAARYRGETRREDRLGASATCYL